MNKILLILLGIAVSLTASAAAPALQSADRGEVHRHYLWSPQMGDTITVDVWTPEGYSAKGKPYPVIYAHDGQNLFDANTTWNHQAWELDSVLSLLQDRNLIAPPVVVGIHCFPESRVGDLAPQKAIESIPDSILKGFARFTSKPMRGDAYAAFMVNTLKPFINSRYNVSKDPEQTALLGSSMGGLMSIYALCEYPSTFGTALCLSTHWIGDAQRKEPDFQKAMAAYLQKNLPPRTPDSKSAKQIPHRIYFDRGTSGLDALYDAWEAYMITLLNEKGYNTVPVFPSLAVDLPALADARLAAQLSAPFMAFTAPDAEHQERFWKRRVALPLAFFLYPLRK